MTTGPSPGIPAAVPSPLPDEAVEEIAQLLAALFKARYRVDVPAEAFKRLGEAAIGLRGQLELRPRAPLSLKPFLADQALETVIYRAQVEAWLALRSHKAIYSNAAPEICLACGNQLSGAWTCQACGLEMDNSYLRKKRALASVAAIQHLPLGHMLLADPERSRLLFLDWREPCKVVWAIEADRLDGAMPTAALCLPGRRLLVCDSQAGRVFEAGLFGEIYWEYEQAASPRHGLNRPLKATLFRLDSQEEQLLIVDSGNHRVLIVDRRQRILWQYGETGRAGSAAGLLAAPTDAQLTLQGGILICDQGNQRVLEVDPRSNKLLWSTASELGLLRPVAAERLPSRRLLILDAGNARLIELDAQGSLQAECFYNRPVRQPGRAPEPQACGLRDEPLQMIRRENQRVILVSCDQLLEVDLGHQRVQGLTELASLTSPGQEDKAHSLEADPKFLAQVIYQDAPPAEQLNPGRALRHATIFAGAPEAFYAALPAYLSRHSYASGEVIVREGEPGDAMFLLRAGQVQVSRSSDSVLLTLGVGEIFGELALLKASPRSETVIALTPVEVFRLKKWAFETLSQLYPEMLQRLAELALSRALLNLPEEPPEQRSAKVNSHMQALFEVQRGKRDALRQDYQHRLGLPAQVRFRPSWRLPYSRSEQTLIHDALPLSCYELHTHTRHAGPMSYEQACDWIRVLEGLGTVIRIEPPLAALKAGEICETLVAALLTAHDKAQLRKDLSSLPALAPPQIHPILFQPKQVPDSGNGILAD